MKDVNDDMELTMITRYLGNELDAAETEKFDRWLAESDDHRAALEEAKKLWTNSKGLDINLFNTDQGWNKMNRRIHPQPVLEPLERKIFPIWLKIAASIVLILGIAFALKTVVNLKSDIEVVAENQKSNTPVILPDGSKVYLNAGSVLKYPKKFNSSTRLVQLQGEGFFEVARNEKCPFIINTGKAQIKVLGTSFNVNAYSETDSVQVVVETGTVELSSGHNDSPIRLTKGNTGVYYSSLKRLTKSDNSDANAIAWKTNIIVFHNVDLNYVSQTLKKVFSKNISIENVNLKNCRLNADYKNQDLEHILEAIKTTLNLDIIKTNDGYLIKGKGC